MNVAAWAWAAPSAALAVVTAAEAWLASRRGPDAGTRAAGAWASVYVLLAVLFGLGIGVAVGWAAAGQFYAGYLTEYSLSLDNLFVFWVIMRWFAVPPARQQRVLLAGIVLALVLRSALIVAGSAAISHFGWLFYPLGAILLWTAAGLLKSPPDGAPREPRSRLMSWLRQRARQAGEDYGGPLIAWRSRRPTAGPVLLLAVAIGLADLLFAFDSIPALFGITTSAWLIVACNAFALSGLRQVYVLLSRVLDRITYLNRGLAVICAFIGAKLLLQALRGSGAAWAPAVPAWLSLTVIGAVLLITDDRRGGEQQADGGAPRGERARRSVPACRPGPGWRRAESVVAALRRLRHRRERRMAASRLRAADAAAVRYLRPRHRLRAGPGGRSGAARTVRRTAYPHGRRRRSADHPG